jgi:chromosome partitioning protein
MEDQDMKVLTLVNEKGGVGKTTLARHIAAGLALNGSTVLLIDADPQGNSTHQMRLKPYGGLYRLLVQQESWETVMKGGTPPAAAWAGTLPTIGQLMVLRGNEETRAIPGLINDVTRLRMRLEEVEQLFDYVVIDTSPTPSMLQPLIYIATDALLYPTQAQLLSLDGLASSVARVTELNKTRKEFGMRSAQLLGVVPTMVRNTTAHAMGLDMIEQHFGESVVYPALSMMTAWQDAEFNQETLYTFAPGHEATRQMTDVMSRIERDLA